MKNFNWVDILTQHRIQNIKTAVVTVIENAGSTPCQLQTKMLVTAEKFWGTIGGGHLELDALKKARHLLQQKEPQLCIHKYNLSAQLGQCCGGKVTLLIEPFFTSQKTLYLFGAGHIGKEIVKLAENLGIYIYWIDERKDEFPTHIPSYCNAMCENPLDMLADIPSQSSIAIITHSHSLDFELLHYFLKKESFSFLGMIGSQKKWLQFQKKLRQRKITQQQLNKVNCPIGLCNYKAKTPKEIALSFMSFFLQQYQNEKSG